MTRRPRLIRALELATAVGLLSLVVGLLALGAQGWDERAHARFLAATQRGLELDAILNADIARARLGIVTHYDDLVRSSDAAVANLAVLEAPPPTLAEADREALGVAVAAYRELLGAKGVLLERFKSDLALLRNALHLLPVAADALRADASVPPDARGALEHLLDAVLLLAVAPDPARMAAARCDLAGLGVAEPDDPACPDTPAVRVEGPVSEAVLRHARVVVAGQLAMEERVGVLMTLPVTDAVHAVQVTFRHGRAAAEARRRLHILSCLLAGGATLVFGALTVIARLHSQARALEVTTERLGRTLVELEVERDRVVELSDLRSRFLSMTSHEFRTPLSLILSSADLLGAYAGTWSDERRHRHLGRIRDAARQMTHMLDRVLLLGRAEAGMLEARPRTLALGALAESVVDEIRAVVGPSRRLDYTNASPGGDVTLDEDLVRQVLLNLLSNAFKYSAEDTTVRFTVATGPEGARFEIEDEGIGIPTEDLPRLFVPFQRAENARDFKGTGLGLAIVKRSLDVQGGSVTVESTLGRGSRFTVRLPNARDAA